MDIKNIILEEIDDFDWVRDTMFDPLMVGSLIFISPIDTDAVDWPHNNNNSPENYIVLRLTDIDEHNVYYDDVVSTLGESGFKKNTDMPNARRIIKSGYWRVLDPNIPKELLTKLTRSKHFLPYIIHDGNKM